METFVIVCFWVGIVCAVLGPIICPIFLIIKEVKDINDDEAKSNAEIDEIEKRAEERAKWRAFEARQKERKKAAKIRDILKQQALNPNYIAPISELFEQAQWMKKFDPSLVGVPREVFEDIKNSLGLLALKSIYQITLYKQKTGSRFTVRERDNIEDVLQLLWSMQIALGIKDH